MQTVDGSSGSDSGGGLLNGRTKYEEELVGRNVTNRVVKATLCWPDTLTAKNAFIDVL